ncbi:hypothetical protein ACFX14_015330 [Malus domestica]
MMISSLAKVRIDTLNYRIYLKISKWSFSSRDSIRAGLIFCSTLPSLFRYYTVHRDTCYCTTIALQAALSLPCRRTATTQPSSLHYLLRIHYVTAPPTQLHSNQCHRSRK